MLQIWNIVFVLCNVAALIPFGKSERCGPRGRGRCKMIWNCPEALEVVQNGGRPPICGYHHGDPVVCCISHRHEYDHHDHHHPHSPISQTKCRDYEEKLCDSHMHHQIGNGFGIVGGVRVKSKEFPFMCRDYEEGICEIETRTIHVAVVGGHATNPKELPFMGLVGYGNRRNIDWACGCSLISEKFALSAAHCTKHPSGGFAQWIRLGELDLASNNENASPEDHRIIRRINHPDYRSQFVYNDIALFELEKEIQRFTAFIQPICLPRRESFENVETVVGAGWGATDTIGPRSTKLLKVDLNYYSLDQCAETASDRSKIPDGLDERTMICAGSLEGGRDTCLGDSGGPLFLPRDENKPKCSLFTQLGITSFGKLCAVKGLPGIYTNVLFYVPWIEEIVWPRNNTAPGSVWSP